MKVMTEIQPDTTRKNEKIQSIQELRAVGFLLIFVSHYSFTYYDTSYLGALGVQIFIMITGFLLALSKDKNLEVPVLKNVLLKAKRLFPLHITTFIISLPTAGLISVLQGEYSLTEFYVTAIINLSMMQSFVPVKSVYFSFNSVSWYLTLVILFAALSKPMLKMTYAIYRRIHRWGVLLLYSLEIIWCSMARQSSIQHWLIYVNPFVRLLDLAVGMLLGHAYKNKVDKGNFIFISRKLLVLILALGFVYGLGLFSFFNENYGSFYLDAAWTPITIILLWGFLKVEGKFESKILLWMGNISLELFFIHQLVIRYWNYGSSLIGITNELIGFSCCLILSVISALIWRKVVKQIGIFRSTWKDRYPK